ncbi:MAG TPA: hypothetical protein VH879_02085 [Gemmatimonadales bacterium]|jgi:hypothetical protein
MLRLHQTTRFPLEGAHLTGACESCHAPTGQGGLQFVAMSTRCMSCHQSDFLATRDPDHQAGGFPQACDQCHDPRLWNRVHFNHRSPLTGAHRALTCDQCHAGSRYEGTPANCVGCHQKDYDQATQPNHPQSGFSTVCADCHSTASWTAPYDHSRTQFPLTGAHRALACDQCHADGVYAGKATACASCHQSDFDATTNPSHRTLGFSTTCTDCHTTTTWQGAKFDHDGRFFPIYSGRHRGTWSSCSECHASPNDFGQFTCFTCHEHDKSRMDSVHRGRSGYSYDSNACYRCHPVGRAED